MKKINILSTFVLLNFTSIFAQKIQINTLESQFKHHKDDKFYQKSVESAAKAGTFVQDSFLQSYLSPPYFIDILDRYKYQADCKLVEVEEIYTSNTVASFYKMVNSWDNNTNTVTCTFKYSKPKKNATYKLYAIDSFFYDNKNRKTSVKNYFATKPTNANLSSYQEYRYPTDHPTEDTLKQFRQDSKGKFFLAGMQISAFDTNGNRTEYVFTDGKLGPFNRQTYEFNNKNLLTKFALQDFDNNNWVNDLENKYTYNSDDKESKDLFLRNWNKNTMTWSDSSTCIYHYNTDKNIEKQYYYDFDADSLYWKLTGIILSSYDINKNHILDVRSNFENGKPSSTENYRYWWTFCDEAIAGKDISLEGYNLTFPNPIENGQFITVDSPNEVTMTLSIFDTNGRTFSSHSVQNHQQVPVQIQQNGNFVLVLTDSKGRILTVKKVVKID
ncbi:MAG: T9SS type A sorting domain-containing protein [Saprospiraceae bacterium]